MTTTKRRARRIAADEAHAWARNLRLRNTVAKFILCDLTQYVDGDGFCFASIPTIAEDTELSPATVRTRLAWLESVGVIARSAQWVDEHGHRNGNGRGRRTSDLIRLMIDVDEFELEDRAAGMRESPRAGAEDLEADPLNGAGSGLGGQAGRPSGRPSSRPSSRPCDSVEGLISEPEPDPEYPLSPQGDASEPIGIEESEPEHFAPAWEAWPGHQVMRKDLALAEFKKLDLDQQRLCRAAIPQFIKMQAQLKRTMPTNFHLWIRNRGFAEFPTATLEEVATGASTSFDENSREGKAIKALYAFARTSLFINRGRVVYPLPVTTQVLAFADLPDQQAWQWIDQANQLAAWSTFLSAHIPRSRPDLVATRADGSRGMITPWPWPPRKGGSTQTGDAA